MKDDTNVPLTLENVLAGRIKTQFAGDRTQRVMVQKFENAIQAALRTHKNAPDDALIPVSVELTMKEARLIQREFKQYAGYPTDRRVYDAVTNAIKAIESQ